MLCCGCETATPLGSIAALTTHLEEGYREGYGTARKEAGHAPTHPRTHALLALRPVPCARPGSPGIRGAAPMQTRQEPGELAARAG